MQILQKDYRRVVEFILSHIISNDTAYRISNIGKEEDIEKYNTPLSPFEIYNVSPSVLNRYTGREFPPWKNRESLLGKVMSGNWDQQPIRQDYPRYFEERSYYKIAKLYFQKGIKIEEMDLASSNEYDVKDVENAIEHVKRIENLMDSMSNKGYITQTELNSYPHNKRKRFVNEVTVDISRDGEFLFVDSTHRLTAAKLANLDSIPVTVLVRHQEWVEKLESAVETDNTEGLPLDHPEVQRCLCINKG